MLNCFHSYFANALPNPRRATICSAWHPYNRACPSNVLWTSSIEASNPSPIARCQNHTLFSGVEVMYVLRTTSILNCPSLTENRIQKSRFPPIASSSKSLVLYSPFGSMSTHDCSMGWIVDQCLRTSSGVRIENTLLTSVDVLHKVCDEHATVLGRLIRVAILHGAYIPHELV